MRRVMTWLAVAGMSMGCHSDDVHRRVMVIVPAEIASVPSGVLRLGLWAYDPRLADAPALAIDARELRFTHVQGKQNIAEMAVGGAVPAGAEYYISIRGFEVLPGGERYILWDGLEGTAAPTLVVMRAVPTPPTLDH
jgi:hypothetical protein